jgi:hypothetical protein
MLGSSIKMTFSNNNAAWEKKQNKHTATAINFNETLLRWPDEDDDDVLRQHAYNDVRRLEGGPYFLLQNG